MVLRSVLRNLLAIVALVGDVGGQALPDLQESLEKYAPKSCKYNLLPSSLGSRAFKAYTDEVHLYDVFGMPAVVKRHIVQLDIESDSFLTLQAEVHRDTPTTLAVDVYQRGMAENPAGLILSGLTSVGAGGDGSKIFLHGKLPDSTKAYDIVFQFESMEVAAAQVDARGPEDRCWPIRVDLSVIPTSRAALHWPTSCPKASRLPKTMHLDMGGLGDGLPGMDITVLPDAGLQLDVVKDQGSEALNTDMHYNFKFSGERPWEGFTRALWSSTIEVPQRMHRFVRLFFRVFFRFSSSPLQLVLELFELTDEPDGTALIPTCAMGCLGGVPVYNGQLMDHAMPTGFRYKIWILAASMSEWTSVMTRRSRQCLEFDFDYSVKFEEKLTPFEVGPGAWLCEYSRLPTKIVQTQNPATDGQALENVELVAGRSIWIRDRFGFPPDEVSEMDHQITVVVSEPVVFRATTHHSDGVDVYIVLTKVGEGHARACRAMKHPGPVPRQSIFCTLQPGQYTLTFSADYPLGGLHPCSDFFAQIALRPLAIASELQKQQCIDAASDTSNLKVQRNLASTVEPKWHILRVPIEFKTRPTTVKVWTQTIEISEEEVSQRLYMRLVLQSDYVSSDLRFQVKYEGRYVADTQVTAHGYADMMGPLDPGTYTLEMYYMSGQVPLEMSGQGVSLCGTSMADFRIVSQSSYAGNNALWLCTSNRVPPPDTLQPQLDEQVLLDSQYVVPASGYHNIKLDFGEERLVRVKLTSADASFTLSLRELPGRTVICQSDDNLECLVPKGSYSLRLRAKVTGIGGGAACSTMQMNMLLQPTHALVQCPWSPKADHQGYETAWDRAQKDASDHFGQVLLDLVPEHLSSDTYVKPPITLWMSTGMEKTFEMNVDQVSALRMDVMVHPPFLPLEVTIRRKRSSGKLEPPLATAEWVESRLLLLQNEIPRGRYVVELLQPRKYNKGHDDIDSTDYMCAHVTIFAQAGVVSKEATESMRSELLLLPDLLAVQPFPPSLNAVAWYASGLTPSLGTQVYRFPEGQSRASLRVEEAAVIRVVCEPADLSNAEADVHLEQDGRSIMVGDELGHLVHEVQAGLYDLVLKPRASAPFLVTVGVATMSRLKEDILLQDSARGCKDVMPDVARGVDFAANGWSVGPTLVRLSAKMLTTNRLATIPITIAVGSILYIEVGSGLPLDLVRIGLQVQEGLWVGEQRGMRNSLQVEIPPGKYVVQLQNPVPGAPDLSRCLDFSVFISAKPLVPVIDVPSSSIGGMDGGGSAVEQLSAFEQAAADPSPCFSMGTVPLPLDLSDAEGGSRIIGGPLGKDGRLLIRSRVLITDMHDGRKKMFLATGGKKLIMKVGVSLGGYKKLTSASQLSFMVKPSAGGSKLPLDPLEEWSVDGGWERVFILESSSNGYWLSFHHSHRERTESACIHFGLELEIHPFEDLDKMHGCNGATARPEEFLPDKIDLEQSQSTRTTSRYSKKLTYVSQEQIGFLRTIEFTLRQTSFISAEIGHNFLLSHAEMDVVLKGDARQTPVAFAEADYFHETNHPLNTRQLIGKELQPGTYLLRIADDHFSGQAQGASSCFPFSFDFQVVPEAAQPTIVSIHPHPSVPRPRGVDFVVTLRFSEPPRGTHAEILSAISLGGVESDSGGSMEKVTSEFDQVPKAPISQAISGEGELLWVITWSAKSISSIRKAKLEFGTIRTNQTNRLFQINSPTYRFTSVPKGVPWAGETTEVKDPAAQPPTPPMSPPPAPPPAQQAAGYARPEGTGVARPEGSSRSDPNALPPQYEAWKPPADPSRPPSPSPPAPPPAPTPPWMDDDYEPVVVEWNPNPPPAQEFNSFGASGGSQPNNEPYRPPLPPPPVLGTRSQPLPAEPQRPEPARQDFSRPEPYRAPEAPAVQSFIDDTAEKCPKGTKLSESTGICETVASGGSWLGQREVTIAVVVALVYVLWPKLKAKLGGMSRGGGAANAQRFNDIGARSSEEEVGLMGRGRDTYDDDDDDML